ncbi:MAG: hypothetical protein HDS31_01230 [Bacteroides sp.]|nr:hypothetical protein [Bacteroides sp.]
MTKISKYILGSIIAAGFLPGTMSAAGMMAEWRTFPSADWRSNTNTMRVVQYCPTDRYVYVLMHGQNYDNAVKSNIDYGFDAVAHLNLFYLDTNNPDAGFQPIGRMYPDSKGVMASCMGYNVEKDYLIVTYQDGTIEILYADGHVARITDFMDAKVPGSKKFNSVSFSPEYNEIYLAAQNGYVVVDDTVGTLKEWVRLWSPVNYITRMGDTLVAVAPVKTIISSGEDTEEVAETTVTTYKLVNGTPESIADFIPVKMSDTANVPKSMVNTKTGNLMISDGVLPLTGNTFMTVGQTGTNNNGFSAITLTLQNDGSYRPLTIVDSSAAAIQAKFIPFSRLTGGINATKDGYCLKGGNFHLIRKGIDPDFTQSNPQNDYKSKVVTDCILSVSGVNYNNGASFDGVNFWIFKLCGGTDVNGGFVKYVKGSDGKLTLADQKILPAGPGGLFGRNITYVPGYGMVVPSKEYSTSFMQSYKVPDYSALFDGENWKPFGLTSLDPSQSGVWNGGFGVTIDPDNPKYIYSGSYDKGILRRNLEDPSDLLHITFGSNYSASRSMDVEVTPGYSSNGDKHTWPMLWRPTFDADGRMWSCSFNHNIMYDKTQPVPVFYWEKEDRLASKDKESYRPMKLVKLEKGSTTTNKLDFAALSHPRNRNKLVYVVGDYETQLTVIDHNGTPGDTSDDRYVTVANGVDDDGRRIIWDYIYFIEEDKIDGRVWLFAGTGLYWIDPTEFMSKPGSIHRMTVDRFEGTDAQTVIAESAMPTSYAVDSYNRKWFGLNGGGIICISADNKEQIAHFDTANSPLLSDAVHGLGWNPERHSLMISTDIGYQEATLLDGVSGSSAGVAIYPSAVTADHKGYVTINAAIDAHRYSLRTKGGSTVCRLQNPQQGATQWDLTDSDGKRVASGIYELVDETTGKVEGQIIVVE